jgi:hypothetical protein
MDRCDITLCGDPTVHTSICYFRFDPQGVRELVASKDPSKPWKLYLSRPAFDPAWVIPWATILPSETRMRLFLDYQPGCFWPLLSDPDPRVYIRYEKTGFADELQVLTPHDRTILRVVVWKYTPARYDAYVEWDLPWVIGCILPTEWKQVCRAVHAILQTEMFGGLPIPPGLIHAVLTYMGVPMCPDLARWLYVRQLVLPDPEAPYIGPGCL